MPTPGSALGTIRPDISGIMLPYDQDVAQMGYIGDRVLPPIDVSEVEGSFAKVEVAALLQNIDTIRGKDGRYAQSTWEWGKTGWRCLEYGLEERVDRRDARRYANWFDAEVEAARRTRDLLALSREIRIAGMVYNATTWTPTAVTNEWDDSANAGPIADVHAAKQRMWANGMVANALIVNRKVYENLRICEDVREAVAASGAGARNDKASIGVAQLRGVFDLEHILVADGVQNTADEGQTGSLAPVWSDEYAAVCKIATDGRIQTPCVGRTFHYTPDGSQIGGVQESYWDPSRRSEIVRSRMDADEQLLIPGAVELLSNITT